MIDDFWQREFGITPEAVSDTVIWRAANQIIKMFPEEPELAACQRADAAYEAGDMFNFDLWRRVAKAIKQLLHTAPNNPAANN